MQVGNIRKQLTRYVSKIEHLFLLKALLYVVMECLLCINFYNLLINTNVMQPFLVKTTCVSVYKIGFAIRSLRESLGLTREVVADLGVASHSTLRHIEAGHSCCLFSLVRLIYGLLICLKTDDDVTKFCAHLLALLADLFNIKIEKIKKMTLEELVAHISSNLKADHEEYKNNQSKIKY